MSVLRTALTPKFLGLLAFAIAFFIATIFLGRWQMGVAHDRGRLDDVSQAGQRPAVELTTYLDPGQAFPADASGQLVDATGRYVPAHEALVGGRLLDGRDGYWVVTALRTQEAVFPVVRGWVPDPADVSAPPTGTVTVRASLAPSESPVEGTTVLPAGQIPSIDTARLVNLWDGTIYNAIGFAQSETRDGAEIAAAAPMKRIPPPMPNITPNSRNVAYAIQWWAFGVFGFWFYWRMLRTEVRLATPTPVKKEPIHA